MMRRKRLLSVCGEYGLNYRVEYGSVFKRKDPVNKCTGSYFTLAGKDHFICNVLKGGSTSWQRFLDQNKIPTSLLAECVSRDGHYTCP